MHAVAFSFGLICTLATVGFIVALVPERRREKVSDWFSGKSWRLGLIPGAILLLNLIITTVSGKWNPELFGRLLIYLVLPTLLIAWVGRRKVGQPLGFTEILFILLLWIPVELRFILKSWEAVGMKYPLTAYTVIVFALIVMTGWRRLPLNLDWPMCKEDLVMVGKALGLLALILIPPALLIGFAVPKISSIAINYPYAVPLVFVAFLFAPALAEELIFRGAIQNTIAARLGDRAGLILSSLIFGVAHINNKVGDWAFPNYPYVALASVAGFAYGYVYIKRRSLLAAVLLHASVDFIWWLTLRGNQ